MVMLCPPPVPVHQQRAAPSTIRLLSQLDHPVRKPKYHPSVDVNLISLVSSFPSTSFGHPADVPLGQFTNHYSGHQPMYYRTPCTSATAMDPSSSFMDLTPFTYTNPPQLPASYTSWPGNFGTANPLSLGDQAYIEPTSLQPLPPTTSNEFWFLSQPPSRYSSQLLFLVRSYS